MSAKLGGDNISTPFWGSATIKYYTQSVVIVWYFVLIAARQKVCTYQSVLSTYLQQPATVDKVCHSLGRDS